MFESLQHLINGFGIAATAQNLLYCLHYIQMLDVGFYQGRLVIYVVCCRGGNNGHFLAGCGFMVSKSDIWN